MPRLGMEPIRRNALVKAAIAEVGESRSLDVTVGRIAGRAGMSTALAHHYFGSKDQMLVAAMRHILTLLRTELRRALATADSPSARVEAVVRASFAPSNFAPSTAAAWLHFYVQSRSSDATRRLLRVYHRRLRSNLLAGFRPLVAEPEAAADTTAALIDGLYLYRVLHPEAMSRDRALDLVLDTVARLTGDA